VPWGKGMAGLAALRGTPVDACNIQTTNSPDVQPGARATGVQGAIVVPMLLDGQVVGTIGIGSASERTFTPAETEWLMSHAARLAAELEGV
jgi:putative methionine-R-sulfoxide reductase with GAF domain